MATCLPCVNVRALARPLFAAAAPVEEWLGALERSMFLNVRLLLRDAVTDYTQRVSRLPRLSLPDCGCLPHATGANPSEKVISLISLASLPFPLLVPTRQPRTEWILRHHAQTIIAGAQIFWARECERALIADKPVDELRAFVCLSSPS